MDCIFHEKQEGYLCAQHCLNALLQGQYYDAVNLASLADQMDQEERLRMAESGVDTDEYRRFLEQPSGNMDDSGYFSVQVISSALKNFGLELVPYNSTEPIAITAQEDPTSMKAYICNYKGHWFTIRKIGNQWFNLNSMLSGPQLISDTYVAMYLAQLIQEGYSIFIVTGTLPECKAEEVLSKNPVQMKSKPNAVSSLKPESKGYRLGTADDVQILKTAQAFSDVEIPSTSFIKNSHPDVQIISEKKVSRERIIPIKIEGREDEVLIIDDDDDEEKDLQKALQLSLQENEMDNLEKNLKLRLEKSTNNPCNRISNNLEDEEDDELRRALQLSLECVTAPPTPNQEEIRWRRLAYHSGIRAQQTEASTKLNT